MIDCHNHLQDEAFADHLEEIVDELRNLGVCHWGVNGTSEEDWERVAILADRYPEVTPFFGLHPWKCEQRSADWFSKLRDYLEQFPDAGLGEVGLDKWIRNVDFGEQDLVFRKQMEVALELKRPLLVHCLQAWGIMKERIEEYDCGGSVLLHSYGGPLEMVSGFEKLGACFSISGYFFKPEKSKKLKPFLEVAPDRLLVETDAPDMSLPESLRRFRVETLESGNEVNHPANISAVYQAVAELRGIAVNDLQIQAEANWNEWLARGRTC